MTTMMKITSSSGRNKGHDEASFSTKGSIDNKSTSSDDNHGLKNSPTALSATLSKMNSVAKASLHRSIRQGKKGNVRMNDKSREATTDNNKTRNDNDAPLVDYLTVKNSLMISYLIDLTFMLRSRLLSSADDGTQDGGGLGQQEQMECLERLQEMKIALEKMRPLEKKMRYQIDKLLALSTVLSEEDGIGGIVGGSAGMFASVGREVDDSRRGKKIGNDITSDPLSFKPDLYGMMKNMLVGEDDGGENDGYETRQRGEDDRSNHDDIDMQSSRRKIFLDKEDTGPSSNVYQPPRLQSVPFELDKGDRIARKLERDLEKKRERQSRSELTQVIKSQFTDAPEEEDARGGASLGLQSDRSRKISTRNAEVEAFEEGHMMRLSVGRKDKKERKRMMREEMSNLGAIADGLGNVVSGVDDAFGGGRRHTTVTSDGGAGHGGFQDAYKTKGMRRRKVDVIDHEGVARKKKKKSAKSAGAANTYQKSLYGAGGGGGGGRGGGKSRK